jgi:hypothetical protein
MPGKPFQSKLTPHFDLIRQMRRERHSWQEIVEYLRTLGVTTNKGNVCTFFVRHRVRPHPLGMESGSDLPAPSRRKRDQPPEPPLEMPELTDSLPLPSEFGPDPLTISRKARWGTITKT